MSWEVCDSSSRCVGMGSRCKLLRQSVSCTWCHCDTLEPTDRQLRCSSPVRNAVHYDYSTNPCIVDVSVSERLSQVLGRT
eukprot:m.419723 g.419723  ORF g.419723 m.419723 type:complete len:80 (-) comp21308_c0_seq2:2021-2260(-)